MSQCQAVGRVVIPSTLLNVLSVQSRSRESEEQFLLGNKTASASDETPIDGFYTCCIHCPDMKI